MPAAPAPKALTEDEERTWRALIRLMLTLPRAIDEDLSRRGGLSLTHYVVLMRLSEGPDAGLRMSDLAGAAALSPSRMTRIVQAMLAEELVTRAAAPGDARAALVRLTDRGLARLQEAWPAHLAGVRALVLDHLDPADLSDLERMVRRLLAAITAVVPESEAGCG